MPYKDVELAKRKSKERMRKHRQNVTPDVAPTPDSALNKTKHVKVLQPAEANQTPYPKLDIIKDSLGTQLYNHILKIHQYMYYPGYPVTLQDRLSRAYNYYIYTKT